MSDLIRRSDVIDILRKNASNDIQDQVLTENNINLVNSIPTVVDLDRVISALMNKMKEAEFYAFDHSMDKKDGDVLKIVNERQFGYSRAYAVALTMIGGGVKDASKIKFWLDGCDISFVAEAPRDITLEQLLKQCDRIVPAWCTCGIRSAEERDETEIIIDYNNIRKVDDDVNCTIKEDE